MDFGRFNSPAFEGGQLSLGCMIVLVLVVIAVVVVVIKCTGRENYKRSCIANDCLNLQRTPVDFYLDPRNNPHVQADKSGKYQPLEDAPVDLLKDLRSLDSNTLFKQYNHDWTGCGSGGHHLINDEKGRFDLTNVGDHRVRVLLDDIHTTSRFGPKIEPCTEASRRPYDTQSPIYFGDNGILGD